MRNAGQSRSDLTPASSRKPNADFLRNRFDKSCRCHVFRCGLMVLLGAVGLNLQAAPVNAPQILKLEWGERYLQTEVQCEQERQSGRQRGQQRTEPEGFGQRGDKLGAVMGEGTGHEVGALNPF